MACFQDCENQQEYKFSHLVKQHPCFNAEAHNKYGRIHLPVSPKCNIQCRFCKRDFNKCENRPGVSRTILTPDEAVTLVERAKILCPQLTVVGIAGPGDTLATNHAIITFQKIHEKFPELTNCLSTNGLMLREKAEDLIRAGVKTVTVTVNAVDPYIVEKVCSHIMYEGEFMTGQRAARWLLLSQLSGIEKIAKLGAIVKINAVLIPGVNDENIPEIAKETASLGASILNIIPLIPQNEMAHMKAPDCTILNKVRGEAEKYLPVFRHCKHCRADAFGIPGANKDLSEVLYDGFIEDYKFADTFSHG